MKVTITETVLTIEDAPELDLDSIILPADVQTLTLLAALQWAMLRIVESVDQAAEEQRQRYADGTIPSVTRTRMGMH